MLRLFLYGVLQADTGHPHSEWLATLTEPPIPAATRGALWAVPDPLGWFPVLLPGTERVEGQVVTALPALDAAALARLDLFEAGYRRAGVTLEDGSAAQAWLWASPLPADARPIAGGDFTAWLTRTGLPPYRGS